MSLSALRTLEIAESSTDAFSSGLCRRHRLLLIAFLSMARSASGYRVKVTGEGENLIAIKVCRIFGARLATLDLGAFSSTAMYDNHRYSLLAVSKGYDGVRSSYFVVRLRLWMPSLRRTLKRGRLVCVPGVSLSRGIKIINVGRYRCSDF
ncbi:hypothetical protein IW262DRAFT_1032094 [Armillaria fumosa]|nr:hypothetical protein IW262DRAFT_1032094 [Armillaria fumosa]